MKKQKKSIGLAFLALMLTLAAGLACNAPLVAPTAPLATATPYRASTDAPLEPTAVPTETDVPTAPPAAEGPNLVITDVSFATETPAVETWVPVEATVENQGDAVAAGYDLVLISHYGVGPPNPSGVERLPDLVPGATHTLTFEPGLLYAHAGPATVRVLATDTWYELGDPDSTGEAGDTWDVEITVQEAE